MITIHQNLARQIRSVFRRALGVTSRSDGPPIALIAGPEGLCIRARTATTAAEYHLAGDLPPETIVVPFELLAACEGRREDPVTLEQLGDGRVVAGWADGGVPSIVHAV